MDLHPPLPSSFLLQKVEASSEEKLQHFITQCNLQETFVVKILKVVLGDEFVVWNRRSHEVQVEDLVN
jgi:septal ring-binding cell division protein DamX